MIEVAEARSRLAELPYQASAGEEIVLLDNGKPVEKLVRFEQLKSRIAGLHAGEVIYISDDFDDPLPDEVWNFDEDFGLDP